MTEVKRGRGRPSGIPRQGTYGYGKKTKVVRVPEEISENIPEILKQFEQIKEFVDSWDSQIELAAQSSSKGKPSPRYDKAKVMLSELRQYLGK